MRWERCKSRLAAMRKHLPQFVATCVVPTTQARLTTARTRLTPHHRIVYICPMPSRIDTIINVVTRARSTRDALVMTVIATTTGTGTALRGAGFDGEMV